MFQQIESKMSFNIAYNEGMLHRRKTIFCYINPQPGFSEVAFPGATILKWGEYGCRARLHSCVIQCWRTRGRRGEGGLGTASIIHHIAR